MALSRPTCGYGLETCPWQSASCLFVDGRKIRSSNPDKGVKILHSANLTMTMTRTAVALAAAREIVAPSAPPILGVGTACVASAAGGNVVNDNDDDGRPWGGPPLCFLSPRRTRQHPGRRSRHNNKTMTTTIMNQEAQQDIKDGVLS